MRTFEWQGTLPVSSRREISTLPPYILQTEDGCFVTFSRDRNSRNAYDLTISQAEAHRFYTVDKACAARSELMDRFDETTTIVAL